MYLTLIISANIPMPMKHKGNNPQIVITVAFQPHIQTLYVKVFCIGSIENSEPYDSA